MSWELAGRPLRRVLATRLRYLGDVVMSTVVPQVLRAGDRDLEIDFLCEDSYAPVLRDHPQLTRVHRLAAGRAGADSRARRHEAGPSTEARGTWGTIRNLRARRYDLAVDLFFNPRSAWLLRLAGIPLRIGGTERGRRRLYTHTAVRSDPRCAPDGFAAAAPGGLGEHLCRLAPLRHAPSGRDFVSWLIHEFEPGSIVPRLVRPSLDERAGRALASAGCDPGRPYLVAAPGATLPSKEWPLAHWRELLAELGQGDGIPVAILVPPGREGDFAPLADAIPAGWGGALPPLALGSVLGILAGARGLVTVDGGIMHAAVGLGTPVVALFGPTAPGIWFPYGGRPGCRVLATRPSCHPCDRHVCDEFICLPDLKPDAVHQALREVLAEVKA